VTKSPRVCGNKILRLLASGAKLDLGISEALGSMTKSPKEGQLREIKNRGTLFIK